MERVKQETEQAEILDYLFNKEDESPEDGTSESKRTIHNRRKSIIIRLSAANRYGSSRSKR